MVTKQPSEKYQNTPKGKAFFWLSLAVCAYWALANSSLVQDTNFQVIHEMVWIFFFPALFVLPVIAIFYLVKKGFSFKSLYFYAAVLLILTHLALRLVDKFR
jgi:hypothetical protein